MTERKAGAPPVPMPTNPRAVAERAYDELRNRAEIRGHESRTVGAGVGGLVGGMAGSFRGGWGPVVGAAVGALLGAVVGDSLDKKKREREELEAYRAMNRGAHGEALPPQRQQAHDPRTQMTHAPVRKK